MLSINDNQVKSMLQILLDDSHTVLVGPNKLTELELLVVYCGTDEHMSLTLSH